MCRIISDDVGRRIMDKKRLVQLLGAIYNYGSILSDMTREEQEYCKSRGLIFHPQSEPYDIKPNMFSPSWTDLPKNLTVAELTPKGIATYKNLLG